MSSKNRYNIQIVELNKTECRGDFSGSISFIPYLNDTIDKSIEIELTPDFGIIERLDSLITITGLQAREYNLNLSSNSSVCNNDTSFTIEEADTLSIQPLLLGDETCSGDSTGFIYVKGEGGTGDDYTYSWDTGTKTDSLTNLTHGNYTLILSDGNECTTTESFFISEGTRIELKSLVLNQPSCYDSDDGSIQVIAGSSEGVLSDTFFFNWNNLQAEINSDTALVNNIQSGNYPLIIQDEKSCKLDTTIELHAPDSIKIEVDSSQLIVCQDNNNGFISLSAIGGTAPYSYDWENGEDESKIENLSVGKYTLTITDNNSCIQTAEYNIIEQSEPEYDIQIRNLRCSDILEGSIGIDLNSADIIQSISIDPAIDTSSHPTFDFYVDSLDKGQYIITLTDTLGCEYMETVNISSPQFDLDIITSKITCIDRNDGKITVLPEDSSQVSYISIQPGMDTLINIGSVATFDSLLPGSYIITTVDTSLCTYSDTVFLEEPELNYNLSITDNSCFDSRDGQIDISFSNSNPIQSFDINPERDSVNLVNTDISFDSLSGGFYVLNMMDTSNCSYVDTFFVKRPPELELDLNTKDLTDTSLGSAEVIVTGGTEPYTYIWSVADSDNSPMLDSLDKGDYLLVVIDANGCRAEQEFFINSTISVKEDVSGSIKLYPNPASDKIVIEYARSMPYELKILNMDGKVLYEKTCNSQNSMVDISEFTPAMYILQLSNREEYGIIKFIRQR